MEQQRPYSNTQQWMLVIGYLAGLLGWGFDYLEHLGVTYQLFGLDPYRGGLWNGHTPQYIGAVVILFALIPPQPNLAQTLLGGAVVVLVLVARVIANLSGAYIGGALITLLLPLGVSAFFIWRGRLPVSFGAAMLALSAVNIGAIRLIAALDGIFVTLFFVVAIVPLCVMLLRTRDDAPRPYLAAIVGGCVLIVLGLIVDRHWHLAHPEVTGPYNMLAAPGHALEVIGWIIGSMSSLRMIAGRRPLALSRVQPTG